jgi:cytochrome P450
MEQFDPFDESQQDEPFGRLRVLRDDEPIAEVAPGVFYVSRYEDIVAIARDPRTFVQGGLSPFEEGARDDDLLLLGEMNPPEHTKVRRIYSSVMSQRRLRAFEPAIRAVCDELVDGFAARGHAEMIGEYAGPIPEAVTGLLGGFPREAWPMLRPASDDQVTVRAEPPGSPAYLAARARIEAFEEYLRALIRERTRATDRPDDMLTAFIEYVDESGNPLSERKIVTLLGTDIVSGGIETTTHLLGNLLYLLLSTPGAYDRVRVQRTLVPVAVDETLRHSGPVQVLFRTPTTDVEIRGVHVPAGSMVCVGYGSGNRDERVFADPDRFELDRGASSPHLGFGSGIHLCVGAPLARLEVTQALHALLDRFPTMRLAPGFRYRRVPFFIMRGPRRLDVELSAEGTAPAPPDHPSADGSIP